MSALQLPVAPPRPSHLRVAPSGPPQDAALTAAALLDLAAVEEREGRPTAARAALDRALYRFADADEARQASAIFRRIARTHQLDGDAEAALDCLEAALAVAEACGDEAAAGHAVNLQAIVRWQQGEIDEAERLYHIARMRALQAGDARLAAMTAQNLGILASTRGDHEVAQRHYEASLAEYRGLGLTRDVCGALNNLGLLHTVQRQWDAAERALSEAAQISDLAGDVNARIQVDVNLAELWVAKGEYAPAQAAVRRALDGAARTGDASIIGQATKLLGVVARELGDLDDADEHFARADEVATARQEVLLQAEIARERADLARRQGRNREVMQQLNRAHRLFDQLRARRDLADVDQRMGGLQEQFLHVARRWGESIEAKDRYTQGHCRRVADLSCLIAEQAGPARGFDERTLFWFRIGALLHDVGKLVIPPEVLNKPSKLTDEEWALMRSHTTAGVEMVAGVEFPWDVRPIIESHHERWDGKGYPHQLAGEAIPLTARILCVADVYDALTSVRSYKRALSHADALEIMRRDVGTMFDPEVFAWFEQAVADWPERIEASASAEPELEAALVPEAAPASAADRPGPEHIDDLTGLPLRREFREKAERILAARRTTGRPVSLLVIDVDHFKLVNDTFGHLQGDDVLRLVADHVRANTRPSDFAARYAGDEFVVLLPGTRLEEACAVAERLRSAVADAKCPRRDGTAETVGVTLSIGVATAPQHGETVEAVFAAADGALYGAKRAGRDAVTPAGVGGVGGHPEVLLECFVGRVEERQRLRRALDGAARGEPQVVSVTGEAGVGKSTLLKQLAPDVGVRAGSLLIGRCIEADVRTPYGPWVELLRSAVRAGLAPRRPWRELERLVPELATGASAADVPATPVGSQIALLDELEQFLTLATAARPLVLIIDDAQWADTSTWEALEYLLTRFSDQRLLVCLTVRTEDFDEAGNTRRGRLSRSERYSELPLARLSQVDLAQWLRTALGGQTPEPALVAYLTAQSDGNALFAIQTLRALVEDERLRFVDGRWTFDPTPDGETVALPRAIHDLLARRVARLTRPCRDVLAVAAVLGQEFDAETLALACDRPEDEVLDALDCGIEASVLVPSPESDTSLTFAHALLTRVLQTGINPLRLRRIHERVGRALEARGGHVAAQVALHFDRAGCAADAYRTALEAGARAAAVYAYETAADLFEMARRHARELPDLADVAWRLAQIDERRGRYAEAEASCDAVLTTYAAGAASLGVLRAARRMRERLRLLGGAPVAERLAACEALLAEARAAGASDEIVPLLIMVSTAYGRLGDAATSETTARAAVAEAERLQSLPQQADAAMRLGNAVLAASPADAVPHFRRALEIFTQLNDRHGQLRSHGNIGLACDRAGNHPAAEVAYVTALTIAREIGANDAAGLTSLNLGVLMIKTGQLSVARERCQESHEIFAALGNAPLRLGALYNLAHLTRAEGDNAGASELYAATATLAGTLGHMDVQVGALAGGGLADLDLGSVRSATQQYDEARALLAPREDWWFQGRELYEALEIRLRAAAPGDCVTAPLLDRLAKAERHVPYAALWLAAECASALRTAGPLAEATLHRYLVHARALGYTPLVARLRAEA